MKIHRYSPAAACKPSKMLYIIPIQENRRQGMNYGNGIFPTSDRHVIRYLLFAAIVAVIDFCAPAAVAAIPADFRLARAACVTALADNDDSKLTQDDFRRPRRAITVVQLQFRQPEYGKLSGDCCNPSRQWLIPQLRFPSPAIFAPDSVPLQELLKNSTPVRAGPPVFSAD